MTPENIVTYNLTPNRDQPGCYLLQRSQQSGLLTSTPALQSMVLADNVLSLHIRYFDGQRWGESWDSSSLPQGQQLPIAVAIQIQMAAPGGRVMDFATQVTRADGNSPMVTRPQKNERGVAILAVLLGIALMTLIVVDFAMTSGLGFVSAANQANELRAGYLARSAVNIGLALLAQDARAKLQRETPTRELERRMGGAISADAARGRHGLVVDRGRSPQAANQCYGQSIRPSSGTLNPTAAAKVQRLFTVLDVDTDLIQGIIDWITPLAANSTGGGGDFYMGLVPPYQPRYGPMPTIGDLQMVKGFNEAIFNRVSPFLTAMPADGGDRLHRVNTRQRQHRGAACGERQGRVCASERQHRAGASAGLAGAGVDGGSENRAGDCRGPRH